MAPSGQDCQPLAQCLTWEAAFAHEPVISTNPLARLFPARDITWASLPGCCHLPAQASLPFPNRAVCLATPLEIVTGTRESGKSLCFMLGTESSCPKFSWVCQHLLQPSQRKGSTARPRDCPAAG